MDVTGGSLSWAFELDYSKVGNAKNALVKYFNEIGISAEEAGKLADKAIEDMESAIQGGAEALDVLNGALDAVREQMENLDEGTAKEALGGVAEVLQDYVTQMEEAAAVDHPLDELGQEATSAKQQLREMTEELVNMKMRGEENTEEYQQLLEKVGMLKDAMMDTQQAVKGMASDTATLDSVLGAAQLTAGGFSAVMGAMNLVGAGEETKELAEAQKKLQAAIAVTTGLQAVQNALQKQSALMLGINRIQTLAAAKAKAVLNKETGKYIITTEGATIAQIAFNAVANANPYVLLATAILTVVGALFAFTSGTKENEKQQESLNSEIERQIELLQRLEGVYDSLYQSEKKSLENRIELLKAQGASVEEIRAAEDALAEAERKRIEANEERYGKEMANYNHYAQMLELKTKAYNDINDKILAKEEQIRKYRAETGMYGGTDKNIREMEQTLKWLNSSKEEVGKEVEEYKDMVDALNTVKIEREDFDTKMSVRDAKREKEDKERSEKAAKEAADRRKKNLEEEKKYQDELRQARERAEDLENDNAPDNLESRVNKIDTEYTRQIKAAEIAAEKAKNEGKLELAQEYEKQAKELRKKRDAEIKKEKDNEVKAQKEKLDELLGRYQSYEEREKSIRKKYTEDITELEKQRDKAGNAEERMKYEEAIAEAERQQKLELEDLELEYGALNQLNGKRADLERQILLTANKIKSAEDEATKAELTEEMKRLKEELKQVNKEIAEMEDGLQDSSDTLEEMNTSDALSAIFGGAINKAKDLAEIVAEISGATGDTVENIGLIADGVSKVASGYAQGGIIGAIAGAVDWAVEGMISLYNKTKEEIEATEEFQAVLDKMHHSLNINDDAFNTIFGEDALGRIQTYALVYHQLIDKLPNTIRFYTDNEVDNMLDLSKYRMEGLNNNTLEELAHDKRVNLWDSSGEGFNTEFIQMVLDEYEKDLSKDEKKLLKGMLDYSESFQTAMEEIASYLESVFGQVADTIADQFLDTFLESGEAAMDFGAVVSDVARQMAKDFIKSQIAATLQGYFEDSFKAIMADQYLSPEQKQAEIMALLASAQADIEDLQPAIQAYLEGMQQFFNMAGDVTEVAMGGDLLQTASQDSVSLLNGQLNAVRTSQSMMLNRIDSILIQLAGIQSDINDGFNRSVRQLEQINDNTSENGSILRQLGIWIG